MSERHQAPSRSGGFTLVEILVAFAIAALALGVVFQIFTAGSRSLSEADAYRRATLWAQSRLETIGAAEPLVEGDSAGEMPGGMRWSVRIRRASEDGRPEALQPPVRAYTILVSVAWGAQGTERSVALTTLRLEPRSIGAGS
jgi:general secretion pathway protein I